MNFLIQTVLIKCNTRRVLYDIMQCARTQQEPRKNGFTEEAKYKQMCWPL